MKKLSFFLTTLLISAFFSCNTNDDPTEPVVEEPPESTLEELRDETTTTLTSGSTKTWRINHATLTHGNSEIDISQNFNVLDDEFIFGGTTVNGSLQWRKGYDIQTNATSAQETLLDNYVSPLATAFSYQDNSSTIVEADGYSGTFEVNSDNTINATIINDDNTVFSFHLVEKTQADYASAPESGLHFTPAFTFESNSISGYAPGMIGSYANNSLFIATREDGLYDGTTRPERILKFDIATPTSPVESLSFESDFASKQLRVIDNQLIVVGGQLVKQYDLKLRGAPPITANHGKRLSRFGVSVLDKYVYLIGGDLNDVEGDQIFRLNINVRFSDEFVVDGFTTLPEPKSGAGGTIVHEAMYVFGGSDTFVGGGGAPTDVIYKVNMNNPIFDIETFRMNKAIDVTFVQKFQNLIYVAGQIHIKDESGTTVARESTIGVFNTLDNTYQELTTNLTNTSGFDTIHQMCIVNDKIYIIYGNQGTDTGGQFPEWDVLVSDLD